MDPAHQIVSTQDLVIVVDDDEAVRTSIEFSLKVEGYVARSYAGGPELLADLPLPSCKCLIVDQDMPVMKGLELILALRNRCIHTPAILVTGHATKALYERAARCGIPIVEKPFVGSALIDQLHRDEQSSNETKQDNGDTHDQGRYR